MKKRDLLSLRDLSARELLALIARAKTLKALRARGERTPTLAGKTLAMIFEKASTRTRVSFEVGMFELGGYAVVLSPEGSQIGRGEPIADTARVLGGYCHGIVVRTFAHRRAEQLAEAAPVPVINGLTDRCHPCQVVADLMTTDEIFGQLSGLRFAWIGDGNNMAVSWLNAAALLGLELSLACPPGFEPPEDAVDRARSACRALGRGRIEVTADPGEAAKDAHVVSTDVWASMGQEAEAADRARAFAGFAVTSKLLAGADASAVVLHCLPAHRGEEIAADVLDSDRAAVWQQAENRLHAQKAILELLLG